MVKRVLSALLAFALLINFALPVLALEEKNITVTYGETSEKFKIEDEDITNALKDAFSFCASDEEKEYTISVPSGRYYVSSSITLSDNTTLDLSDDVTLVNTSLNVFITKKGVQGFNGTKNVKIIGGELTYVEAYKGTSCLVRMAHAQNIRFENTVFSNNRLSHHVEIAACKDVTFEGCTFKEMMGDLSLSSGEALQIDILDETAHFAGFPEYDGTMNENITVNNCTFSNVVRGVGTQSAYAGLYHKSINITNCTFEDVGSTAISCMNYIDSNISNNKIINCGQGINYYMMKSDSSLSKTLYIENLASTNKNCNTVISNNSINVVKTDYVTYSSPMYIYGKDLTDNNEITFKKDDYLVSNLNVSNNTIDSQYYGIRAYDMINSVVSGNTVRGGSESNGIYLDAKSDSNTIKENTVSGFENGISIKGDSAFNSVVSNTVSSTAGNGIIIQKAGNGNSVKQNSIAYTKNSGIVISNSNDAEIVSNSVNYPSGSGIYTNVAGVSQIAYNTISNATYNGLSINGGSNITSINNNSVSDISNNGIYFSSSYAYQIVSNTINKTKNHGVFISEKSSVSKINSNSINNASVNGLYLNTSEAAEIISNSISKADNNALSVYLNQNAMRIEKNNITYAAKNGAYINKVKDISFVSNKITGSKKNGVDIAGSSVITKLSSNTVSSSAEHGVLIGASAKVSELKKNSISNSTKNGCLVNGKAYNIASNTFTSNKKYAIYFAKTAKAEVFNNTFSKNKKGPCYSAGKKKNYSFSTIEKPSVTLSQKNRNVTVRWKKIKNASSYEITRAAAKKGNYAVLSNVSSKKNSYVNKKLAKGKKYYYKVRTVRKMNGVKLYSSYSSVKNIKVK